jgi:hypothetical protein
MKSARRVAASLVCLATFLPSFANAAEPPNIDELLGCLKIDRSQKQKMMSGEVLTTPVDEGSDKELAVGIVMFVPAPVEKVADFVKGGQLFSSDKSITAFAELKGSKKADGGFEAADIRGFAGVAFDADQTDEAKALLDASAGSKFNLSTEEIAVCRAMKPASKSPEAVRAAAAQAYQKVLLGRYLSFFNGGLSAVAGYDRGGKKTSSPSDELRLALKESTLFSGHYPELQQALLDFPNRQPEGVINRFFWINQRVEKRPTFILVHRMAVVQAEGALMVEQQFYVGHSFNSMQVISGCVAVPGGCLVFHSNHTSTDQVAGFGSGLRHTIGRDQMRDQTLKDFEQMRASLKAK